jgi:hypothetical protein
VEWHDPEGIYSKLSSGRPANLLELRRYTEKLRKAFYLDGPNGYDWIFRNDIIQAREQALYVDYVESDGEFTWWSPGGFHDDELFSRHYKIPNVIRLVTAMHNIGFSSPDALAVIAQVWRPMQWHDGSTYQELAQCIESTLDALDAKALLIRTLPDIRLVLESWTFPLYDVDLSQVDVDMEQLKEVQDNMAWSDYM